MNTNINKSFTKHTDGVQLKIQLNKYDCTKCGEDLGISLNGFTPEYSNDKKFPIDVTKVCTCHKCNAHQIITQPLKIMDVALIKGWI